MKRQYVRRSKVDRGYGEQGSKSHEHHWLYKRWINIVQRCCNKNNSRYHRYGGRGIKVCKEWKENYVTFIKWCLANGAEKHLQIDRKDNDGDYSPGNCRWVVRAEQDDNTCRTIRVTIAGIEKTLAEWSRQYNIKPHIANIRLKRGWDPVEAFTHPVKEYAPVLDVMYNDETMSVSAWARKLGVSKSVLWKRINKGIDPVEVVKQIAEECK
jgi:hypothetical protein